MGPCSSTTAQLSLSSLATRDALPAFHLRIERAMIAHHISQIPTQAPFQHNTVAMAGTRSTTGNSKPRVFPTVSTEPTRKVTTKKSTKAKANTSKPRAKTGAGVKKAATKKAPAKKAAVKEKIEDAAEKVEKKVEKKPAKEKKAKATKPKTTKKAAAKK